jgi:type I restriction enzyme S subunit
LVVKSEYKLSEVGLIPSDWSCVSLETITSRIGDGLHGTPNYKLNGEYPFINGNNLVDGSIVVTSDTKMVEYSEFIRHQKPLNKSSILMSINGTIGNLALFADEKIMLGKSAAYLNVKPEINRKFIYYILQSKSIRKFFFNGLTGSTIGNLGLSTIRQTYIPLPSPDEQRSIALTLNDIDSLIKKLERLILKKRNLKQAAMQQLLTKKIRLSEFNKEWEEKTLIEIANISKGHQLDNNEINPNGDIPHYNGGMQPSSFTDHYNKPANTIVISEGGNSCGFVQFIDKPFWCGGHCYAILPNFLDNQFLFHALKGKQSEIMKLRVGSGLPNIQKTSLGLLKVKFPKDPLEQRAIAKILSDMDMELEVFEERRDKTLNIKQSIMQDLLSGKKRLMKLEEKDVQTT